MLALLCSTQLCSHMYWPAVIMCQRQSHTSGAGRLWRAEGGVEARCPAGRLVWSSRLVCVYLTAPHSCVLSKRNRRPHPSKKHSFFPPLLLFSFPPPPFLVQVAPLGKCQQTGLGSGAEVSWWVTLLAQLFSLLKRGCISQQVTYWTKQDRASLLWGLIWIVFLTIHSQIQLSHQKNDFAIKHMNMCFGFELAVHGSIIFFIWNTSPSTVSRIGIVWLLTESKCSFPFIQLQWQFLFNLMCSYQSALAVCCLSVVW